MPMSVPTSLPKSVLAFDTTMNACAIAVWRDGETLAQHIIEMKHGQAEALVPAIEHVLTESGQHYGDLSRIAVTTGPGSFTGVRVGLATARGLGLALGCPVIGIGTAEVLAATALRTRTMSDRAHVLTAIDARRAEVYVQTFDRQGHALSSPLCALPDAVAEDVPDAQICLTGDAVSRVADHLSSPVAEFLQRHAAPEDLAALAILRDPSNARPAPLYVRPPDAKLPQAGGRLRP